MGQQVFFLIAFFAIGVSARIPVVIEDEFIGRNTGKVQKLIFFGDLVSTMLFVSRMHHQRSRRRPNGTAAHIHLAGH